MKTVTYNTENGTFEFPISDALERLKYHETEMNSYAAEVIERYILELYFYL